MKLKNLLLALIVLITFEAKSQTHACGTPPPDQATQQYIFNEIIKHENDYAAAQAETTPTCIPVQIHIARSDNGNGGFNPNLLSTAFAELNNAFHLSNVRFYLCGINYIDNSDFNFYNTSSPDNDTENQFVLGEEVSNAVNVFVVNSITLDGFGAAGGYAYFPADATYSNRIFMTTNSMVTSVNGTFAHEFGHYFALYHTHEGTENGPNDSSAERVVRTGPNANCATNGDFLCDTDADPRFSSAEFNFCNYTGTGTDDLGVTYNPITAIDNTMSFYPDGCGTGFSAGQYTRINAGLIERLGHSADDYSCLLYTSPSPRDATLSRMPSSA